MLLSIDTTSLPGSLALLDDAGACTLALGDDRPHGAQLPGAALDLVASKGLALGDVDVFAVATGPGSLTGLRVGMATVQGLAFATGKPCVGVSVFDALAWAWLAGPAAPEAGDALGVWLDARRDEVFTALVIRTGAPVDDRAPLADLVATIDAPAVGPPGCRAEQWRAQAGDATRLWVCGTRVERDRALLATVAPSLHVAGVPAGLAEAVARVAAREALHGRTVGPHALHPLYVRRPDVEVARDRARAARPQ